MVVILHHYNVILSVLLVCSHIVHEVCTALWANCLNKETSLTLCLMMLSWLYYSGSLLIWQFADQLCWDVLLKFISQHGCACNLLDAFCIHENAKMLHD